MLSKEFATKAVQEELDHFNENKTLRDFLSDFFGLCNDNDSLEYALSGDDLCDFVNMWADDNHMSYEEMHNFIMKSLDSDVEYNISIDMNYDNSPYKCGQCMNKEARFSGAVIVGNVSLDLEEFFNDFQVA